MCDYSENSINCCKKKSYGEYCNKHKRNHLVKKDLIIFDNTIYQYSCIIIIYIYIYIYILLLKILWAL